MAAVTTERYAPVSGLAVASAIVAGLAALAIVGIALIARRGGGVFLSPALLVPPALGLALATFAGWHVRRSAGALAGARMAAVAWWGSLLVGTGYGAFLIATDLAIRNQAQAFADRWFAALRNGQTEEALRLLVKPDQRASLPEGKPEIVRGRYGSGSLEVLARQDLPRLITQWRGIDGALRIDFLGPRGTEEKEDGAFVLDLGYLVSTPEGQCNVQVGVGGQEMKVTHRREWYVLSNRVGISSRPPLRYTRLGRMKQELMEDSRRFLTDWSGKINAEQLAEAGRDMLPITERERANGATLKTAFEAGTWATQFGQPLDDAAKVKYRYDLVRPGALDVHPGNMMHPSHPPLVEVQPGRLRMLHSVEIMPAKGGGNIPAVAITELQDTGVQSEWDKLSGPGWEKEPTAPYVGGITRELNGRQLAWRVVGIDLRPGTPRLVDLPQLP